MEVRRGLVERLCAAIAEEHAAQVRQVEVIAELCAAYDVVDHARSTLPGRERLVPAGEEGTPLVAEHLATELAPKLQLSIPAAGGLVAESMNLICRHPRLWEACRQGRLRVWQARQIAHTTAVAGLGAAAADWVDHHLEPALGRLPWGRLKARLAGLITRADVDLAAQRAARAQAERFLRVRHNGDGTAFVMARTDSADANRLHRLLDRMAGHLALAGSTDSRDVLRATALGILAEPANALALLDGPEPDAPGSPTTRRRRTSRPTAELIIHLAPGQEIGRCDELGPVLAEQVRTWLGHHRVVVRPVIDLHDSPAVDSYEVPEDMAGIVRLRNAHDVFPWSSRRSGSLDLDHTTPYRHGPQAPPGQTTPDNLGPLSRRAHRAKTHSGWKLTQPAPGTYLWTSPLGYQYRVDHTGSHELTGEAKDESDAA